MVLYFVKKSDPFFGAASPISTNKMKRKKNEENYV